MVVKRKNVEVRFVLPPEQHNRVVAVFALLIEIDRQLNGTKKKTKTKKKDKLRYIYENDGSQRCGSYFFTSFADS